MNRLFDSFFAKLINSVINKFNHAVIWEYKVVSASNGTIDAIPTTNSCPFPPINWIKNRFCIFVM